MPPQVDVPLLGVPAARTMAVCSPLFVPWPHAWKLAEKPPPADALSPVPLEACSQSPAAVLPRLQHGPVASAVALSAVAREPLPPVHSQAQA